MRAQGSGFYLLCHGAKVTATSSPLHPADDCSYLQLTFFETQALW